VSPNRRKINAKENEIGLIGPQRLMFVGYWGWDLKTGKYSWCDEMYRIFNLTPQQPLRTGTFFNGIYPEDRQRVAKALGKALAGEQPYNIQHRIVWPDGSVRSVFGKAEVTFEGDRPVQVFGTVQNITDSQQIKEL
jgi:two-component system, sensor histidine kinase PdtaS